MKLVAATLDRKVADFAKNNNLGQSWSFCLVFQDQLVVQL